MRPREEVEEEASYPDYPSSKVSRKLELEVALDIRDLLEALKKEAEGSR